METRQHLPLLPLCRPGYCDGNTGILRQISLPALQVQNLIQCIPVIHETDIQGRHDILSVIIISFNRDHTVEPVHAKFHRWIHIHTDGRYRYEEQKPAAASKQNEQQTGHSCRHPPIGNCTSPPVSPGLPGKKFLRVPFHLLICMDIVKCFLQPSVTQNPSPPSFSLSSFFERVRSV